MSAEGMPPVETSMLARTLVRLTRLVVRFPRVVLFAAIALAVVSIVLAVMGLGFRTSRLDLLNPSSEYNKNWLAYIAEFGDRDDIVVVVDGPSRELVVRAVDEVACALGGNKHLFQASLHQVDLSKIRAKGLHYLPPADLRQIEGFVDQAAPVLDGDWSSLRLSRMLDQAMSSQATTDPQRERFVSSLALGLSESGGYQSPWPTMADPTPEIGELGSGHFLLNDGRTGLVMLKLAETDAGFAPGSGPIGLLRKLVEQVQAAHPQTQIGLTGLPIMENDEMRLSQSAMIKASFLSLFGVACLFIAGLGGLRHPLMTVAALLLAMAWSFGYITLAIGHLNILSVAFGVILIGLGIDFGIHYVARYLQLRTSVRSCDEALLQTAAGVGPGILTGAITTAIAFLMAGFTDFTGIAELGLIAGGGIVLCLVAALFVLPAMVHLSDRGEENQQLPAPLDIHGWIRPLFVSPSFLFLVTLAGTIVVAIGMGRLWYDHNLLNLQPEGLESVVLEHRLMDESDQSVWFALSISKSPEELLARKDQFNRLPSVERVDEIVSLFPPEDPAKRLSIARIHNQLTRLPRQTPLIPVDPPGVLAQKLAMIAAHLGRSPQSAELDRIARWLAGTPQPESTRRLSDYQQRMAGDLLERLQTLAAVADPVAPCLADLPDGLVDRFVGSEGSHLMKIYARGNIWDMAAMKRFVDQVQSVDSHATGNPIQTYEASRQMKRSYELAAVYALLAIFVVLMVDFRSPRYVLLTMLPLGLGMVQLFGILGLLGIPLNPANMIVLPLILGIGVDDGVHVVHDFRRRKGRYRMSPSTASAVLITSLTTMVGFGSLMIASHRGLQSLGRVLTIGVLCCLFTSLVMLPALLSWLTQDEEEAATASPKSSGRALDAMLRRDPLGTVEGSGDGQPSSASVDENSAVEDRKAC